MKIAFLTAGALVFSLSAANAATVFFDDFEGASAMSGAGGIVDAQGYDGINGIAGSFWHNDTKSLASILSLSGLGAHTILTVDFDIAFIDSWDGAIGRIFGDDYFHMLADGVEVLLTTNFGGIAGELTDKKLGFYGFTAKYDDEAYRVSVSFPHSGDTVALSFLADGRKWQAGADESWAIDNLRISVPDPAPSEVPLPGGLPLMAGALGLIALVRPRRH